MPATARTPGETEKIGKPTAVKTALTAWTIETAKTQIRLA